MVDNRGCCRVSCQCLSHFYLAFVCCVLLLGYKVAVPCAAEPVRTGSYKAHRHGPKGTRSRNRARVRDGLRFSHATLSNCLKKRVRDHRVRFVVIVRQNGPVFSVF